MKKHILLLLIILLLWPLCLSADLSTHTDGTVIDSTNELAWFNYPISPRTWANSGTYAEAFTVGNRTTWRLPTSTELATIVDSTKSPQIDPLIKLGPVRNWTVWSSTEITDSAYVLSDRAYAMFFGNGRTFTASKLNHYSALVVRIYIDGALFDSNGYQLLDSDGAYLVGAT